MWGSVCSVTGPSERFQLELRTLCNITATGQPSFEVLNVTASNTEIVTPFEVLWQQDHLIAVAFGGRAPGAADITLVLLVKFGNWTSSWL